MEYLVRGPINLLNGKVLLKFFFWVFLPNNYLKGTISGAEMSKSRKRRL